MQSQSDALESDESMDIAQASAFISEKLKGLEKLEEKNYDFFLSGFVDAIVDTISDMLNKLWDSSNSLVHNVLPILREVELRSCTEGSEGYGFT